MRCLICGRYMNQLVKGGRWFQCHKCLQLRCSDPQVEFGWQLLHGRKLVYR